MKKLIFAVILTVISVVAHGHDTSNFFAYGQLVVVPEGVSAPACDKKYKAVALCDDRHGVVPRDGHAHSHKVSDDKVDKDCQSIMLDLDWDFNPRPVKAFLHRECVELKDGFRVAKFSGKGDLAGKFFWTLSRVHKATKSGGGGNSGDNGGGGDVGGGPGVIPVDPPTPKPRKRI